GLPGLRRGCHAGEPRRRPDVGRPVLLPAGRAGAPRRRLARPPARDGADGAVLLQVQLLDAHGPGPGRGGPVRATTRLLAGRGGARPRLRGVGPAPPRAAAAVGLPAGGAGRPRRGRRPPGRPPLRVGGAADLAVSALHPPYHRLCNRLPPPGAVVAPRGLP